MKTGNLFNSILLSFTLLTSCKEKEVNPFVVIQFPTQGLILPSSQGVYLKARIEPQGEKLVSYEFNVTDESGKTIFMEKTEVTNQSPDVVEVGKTIPMSFKSKTNLKVQVCASFDDGRYDCDTNDFIFDPDKK